MNHLYLGIDLGGSHVSVQLIDQNGMTRGPLVRRGISGKLSPDQLLSTLQNIVQSKVILENIKMIGSMKLMAVGLAAPGPLDPERGILLSPPNFPNVSHLEIIANLSKRIGLPVFLLNDADAAVLGEAWLGAAKGFENVVMLTLGTEVGSGIIADGKLQRGRGMGGEWGHVPIHSSEARACSCGRYRCLESFCGTMGLARTYCNIFGKSFYETSSSEIAQISPNMRMNWRTEPDWRKVFEHYCWDLKEGIINIAHIHHPDCVVIGGGIASQEIVGEVNRWLRKEELHYKLGALLKGLEVRLAEQNNAGLVGAAKHAMNSAENLIIKQGVF